MTSHAPALSGQLDVNVEIPTHLPIDMFNTNTILVTVAVLLLPVFILFKMWGSKNYFPINGRTVVVTGGSSGMGLSVAEQLSAKGANIVIVAQNPERLEKAIQIISKRGSNGSSQKFLQLSYDLRSPDSAPAMLSKIAEWNNGNPPDIIFNCAGNSIPSFFTDSTLETHRSQMDTIYWSSAYIAHAAISLWMTTPPKPSTPTPPLARHIIFTSSVVALFPIAGYAPYTPPKAAMKALADTLHQELEVFNGANKKAQPRNADINVHIVYPMGILSPGFENENKIKPKLTLDLEKDDQPQTPEEVARVAISRLEAGEFMITTSLLGHIMRGWGMGGSLRSSFMDILWSFIGSLVILFVAPDFMSKCRKWGEKYGAATSKNA